MHVKAGDRRAAAYAGAYVEIVGVLIIAYAFLTPLPLWGQLLAASVVTYAAMVRDAAIVDGCLVRDEALQQLWINHLTLRLALDSLLEQVRAGQQPVLDWRASTAAALEDFRDAREQDTFEDRLGSARSIDFAVHAAGAAVLIPARGLLGFGLAWLLQRYWPAAAQLLIGG